MTQPEPDGDLPSALHQLGQAISALTDDKPDVRQVHCAVCINTGDMTRTADTTVGGYHVCHEHTHYLTEHTSLASALKNRPHTKEHTNP